MNHISLYSCLYKPLQTLTLSPTIGLALANGTVPSMIQETGLIITISPGQVELSVSESNHALSKSRPNRGRKRKKPHGRALRHQTSQ